MSRKSISKYSNVKTWVIENFLSYFCKNGDCLNSPVFSDDKLQLKLFPRGISSYCCEFISCFLEMITRTDEMEFDCKLEMTDSEGNVFVAKKFRLKSFNGRLDFGFDKFISLDEVLSKMAQSKYDSLIVNCHMNKLQAEASCITEYVARTIIGIERIFFTWYLENLGNELSHKKTIHFPKSAEMEIELSASETEIIITIINSNYFDNIYREEIKQDDVDSFNHYNDRFLLCKISFRNIEGDNLLSQLSLMEFEYSDKNSRQCCFKFKQDLLKQYPLQCQLRITYGTYIKHVNSEEV